MRTVWTVLACVFLVGICSGVIEHQFTEYKGPAKRLQGKVTGPDGSAIPWVEIEVYDHPRVWTDDSLSFDQKRAKQHKVASGQTNLDGMFNIGGVPKGKYEVQFRRMGWNILSVVMWVDRESRGEGLCVELQISGGGGDPGRVKSCR